jgi:hypothetical protein
LDVELASMREKESQAELRIHQADDAVLAAQKMVGHIDDLSEHL